MSSLRDRILSTAKPAPHILETEEWGAVYLRILTVGEVVVQTDETQDDKNKPALARAFCRLLCDENGNRVFDPTKQEDINTVLELPWPVVRKVLEEGNAVNKVKVDEPKND